MSPYKCTTSVSLRAFQAYGNERQEIDATTAVVAAAVAQASPSAPLRIFTLGIGATASTAMCEGIARAGNGECLMAHAAEDITGKCAKLLRAGRSFILKNISVDWGIPSHVDGQDGVQVEVAWQQAPAQIASLYPGIRFVVFVLIQNAKFAAPKTVTLKAQRDGAGDILSFSIPVEAVRFADHNSLRLIHTLAARALITDLQDDALFAPRLTEAQRRAAIVGFGETYQLASRYTSFVAVEDDGETPLPIPRPAWAKSDMHPATAVTADTQNATGGLFANIAGCVDTMANTAGAGVSDFLNSWLGPRQLPPRASRDSERDDGDDGASVNTFSTLSSLIGSKSDWSDTDSRPSTPDPIVRSPSPDLQVHATPRASAPPVPVSQDVEQLVRLQATDGSFQANDAFRALVGAEAVDKCPPNVAAQLWATALAVAFFRKQMIGQGQHDLLECLVEKALEYATGPGRGAWNGDFDGLVARAVAALHD